MPSALSFSPGRRGSLLAPLGFVNLVLPRYKSDGVERRRYRVTGIVQGVGFRPFVYGLAGRYGLGGFVLNDGAGVVVEAEGDARSRSTPSRRRSSARPRLWRMSTR